MISFEPSALCEPERRIGVVPSRSLAGSSGACECAAGGARVLVPSCTISSASARETITLLPFPDLSLASAAFTVHTESARGGRVCVRAPAARLSVRSQRQTNRIRASLSR